VYRAVFRAAFIHPGRETRALVPGCIDRALQTFSPLWTAWTLTMPTVLATVLTSWSATQSVRTTYRWSGKASLHLMPARGPLKNESGRSFIEKVERGSAVAAVAPGWTPDFSFHPMGFCSGWQYFISLYG
jgi:hypothetical protein